MMGGEATGGPGKGGRDEMLALLADSQVDLGVVTLDTEGRISGWTRGAERTTGHRAADVLGRDVACLYTEADVEEDRPRLDLAVAAAGGHLEDERRMRRADGAGYWAVVLLSALRDPAGLLLGFGMVLRDVTARKQGEETLRASERRLRLMVENVVDYAIFMLDPQGRVTTWNRGAERLKQYPAEEIIGQHFSRFYSEQDIREGKPQREIEMTIANGRHEDEGWRVRRDGSRFWASVVLTALRGPDGSLQGFAKVTRDLTERKRAEDALRGILERERLAGERLRQLDRARSDFVAILAHDLRAPIGVVAGSADMLLQDWDRLGDESRRSIVQRIVRAAHGLRSLVDDVLDVARIDSGSLRYSPVAVDVVAAVNALAAQTEGGERVRVTEPESGCPGTVWADERRLWQVLANLVGNALKFSPAPEPVEVEVRCAGGAVEVRVTDHGPGIAAEDLGRLFERFSRVPSAGGGVEPGTGLGLYIARSLVEAQGGRIWVESEPGRGSTFAFSLPAPAA